MLKNAKYIEENIILVDEEKTTKQYGKPAQVGYDLSVKNIYEIEGAGFVSTTKSFVPEYKLRPCTPIKYKDMEFNGWFLPKGTYILEANEGVKLGDNDTCYIIMRSSLNRSGVNINSALWDPGYTSENDMYVMPVNIRLTVDNKEGFYLEKNARVAQIICFESESTTNYDGQFNNGRIDSKL